MCGSLKSAWPRPRGCRWVRWLFLINVSPISFEAALMVIAPWLRVTVERLTHANGSIEMRERPGGHALWRLRYAKAESIQRLRWMYYASNVPCLERRKQRRRSSCLRSVMHRCATQVGQGRVVIQRRL